MFASEAAPCSGLHPGAAAPQEGSEGSPSHHGHAGAGRALAPCPGARRLTASPWQLNAGHLQLLRPPGLGYAREPREDIRQQHEDAPGPAQEAPGALLERQGAEKMACSHRYRIQSRGANCPQPNLHTLSQHRAAPFREDSRGSLG